MIRHRGTVLGAVLFVAALAVMAAAPPTSGGVAAVASTIPGAIGQALSAGLVAAVPVALILTLILRRLP